MSEIASLFAAIMAEDESTVRSMLADDPELAEARDPQGVSAILRATYHGQSGIAAALLAQKPTLDIWEAAAVGDAAQVAIGVEENPELLDQHATDGFTPLSLAAFFGHLDAVVALLAVGADPTVTAANAMGVQPLHAAIAHGKSESSLRIAIQLLAHGADPNATQHGGWTPLHAAVDNSDEEMVLVLLKAGADRQAANEQGKTALELALARGYATIAGWLAQPREPR